MKTMKDFSAFKLNKNQMGAMKGGAKCTLTYDNGYQVTYTNEQMDKYEAISYMSSTYSEQFGYGLTDIECEN